LPGLRALKTWRGHLALLFAALLLAGLIGALSGHALLGVTLVLVAYVAWSLLAQRRVLNWLIAGAGRRTPTVFGLHAEIVALIAQARRRDRGRRKQLLAMLKSIRDATAALPDGMVTLTPDWRILKMNRSAQKLLGLKMPQDLAAPITHFVRHPRVHEWLKGGAPFEPLIDLPGPADPSLRLSFRLLDYADHQRLLVVRDISHLMRLEQMRRDFVANVSHELRTPLTVVNGYLDEIDPEELPEWAPVIAELKRQSTRMMSIVQDLLLLSRLDAAPELAPLKIIEVAPMLNQLIDDARSLSQGKHAFTLTHVDPVQLLGSQADLRSAVSNLLTNAVRYTPAGGRIEVRFERSANHAHLSVTDSGIGIPPQHLPRITERFYRVSTDRSRESGGTGLGLAIVKHVLGLHNAELKVTSELGRGSTFTAVFPPERLHEAPG
jgi:two-component system, OmpR family, phosphate regulon sensor histidine kinase PhoR